MRVYRDLNKNTSAYAELANLKYLATPTNKEEKILQEHKHEIPAILERAKHLTSEGECMTKTTEKTMKVCTKCEEEKPLEEFYTDKHGKYGRKSVCKECEIKQHKIKKEKVKSSVAKLEPSKTELDKDKYKKYLLCQIDITINLITKLQGKLETYHELLEEL